MLNEDRVWGAMGTLARLTLNWLLLVLITMSAAMGVETVAAPVHHRPLGHTATVQEGLNHDLDQARECLNLTGNVDCLTPDMPRAVPEG